MKQDIAGTGTHVTHSTPLDLGCWQLSCQSPSTALAEQTLMCPGPAVPALDIDHICSFKVLVQVIEKSR